MGETHDPRQRLARRRRLQVHRRRARPGRIVGLADTRHIAQDPHPPARIPTSSTSRRSATPGGRTRSAASTARSDGGADLGAGPLPRASAAGAIDLVDGPAQPAHPLRRLLGGAARRRSSLISGGAGQRPLQVHRRRRHLDRDSRATRACRRACWARSASPSRPRSRTASGRWSRPRTARSSAPTTAARPGSALSEERDLRRRAWYYMHIFADPQDADTVWVLNLELLEVDRRRQDLQRDPDAARRQPRPLDRPAQPAAHDRGQRRRRLRHASTAAQSWSTHLQPADRRSSTTSPPTTGCPTASTARSRTTRRISVPSRSDARRDHRGRVVRAGRRRERLHRRAARRPEHRLRRRDRQRRRQRPPDRATTTAPGRRATSPSGRRCTAWARAPSDLKYRFQWTFPIVLSPHDPNVLYVDRQPRLPLDRRGHELGGDQPRPDAQRPDASSSPPAARSPRTTPAPRTTAPSSPSPSRRTSAGVLWAGSDDGLVHISRDGGADLGERHAARPAGVGADQHHRALAARPGHRLRRRHALQARRLRALPLQDDRLRPDLDADHRRHPGRRLHARHPRGSGAARPALRRHRDRASTSRSTTARTGSRCQRQPAGRARSTTWSSRTTTWSPPRTAARSGSWTT